MAGSLLAVPKNISPASFRGVIAGATAAYSVKKRVPSVEEITEYCSQRPATIAKVIASPEFKTLMQARGFPFETAKLSPEQMFAISIITDPTSRKPLSTKLKQAGISYPVYRAWLKQPHFQQYLEKIAEDMLGEHVADVHTRVLEKATNGDIQAIKLYYELTGRHDPQKQQMVDLQGIIGLLLEVITRYVPDTNALSKITSDIEIIMSGGVPKALESFDVSRIASEGNAVEDIVDAEVVDDAPIGAIFDFEEPK